MILWMLIFAVFITVLHVLLNYNKRAVLIKKIPGIKDRFLVGNAFDIIKNPVELFDYMREMAKEHDGMYRFWCFPFAAVFIYDPDHVEKVLSGMKYHKKSELYSFLETWLQDGLLLSFGAKWQNRRKIITPAFHFKILRKYFISIEENSHRLVKSINAISDVAVDVVPIISEFTLNSICESAMGTRLTDESMGKSYKNAIYKLGHLLIQRLVRVYLYHGYIFKRSYLGRQQKKYLSIVHNFSRKVIEDRRNEISQNKINLSENIEDNEDEEFKIYNKKKRIAMLDLLLTAEKEGSIDETGIQEEVDTFIFEGHDTTASGLTFFLMLLANHPDIQEKIVAELRDIFGNTKRSAVIEDLAAMNYLDRCIKESLRLCPPVPFISRKLDEEVQLGKYTIPAGTLCHITIYDLHHNEQIYPDPLKFDPDRFLPENVAKRHNFAYVPFSAGPRNCIGQKFAMMEMKLAVSAILRNFVLLPVTKHSDLRMQTDLVLRNSEPVLVRFVKRAESI